MLLNFAPRETDSRFYSLVTQNQCHGALTSLMAPKWDGLSQHYNDKTSPWIRDHPAGQFILPALLCKIGLSSEHSLLATNILYKLINYFLVMLIVWRLSRNSLSWWMLILVQILPISINYLLRSNQEQPLLLAHLLVFYAFTLRPSTMRALLIGGAISFGIAIKAISALPLFVSAWLALVWRKEYRVAIAIAAMSAFFIGLYEVIYRLQADTYFWQRYIEIQIMGRSLKQEQSTLSTFVSGLFYYTTRALLYSLPAAFFAGYMGQKKRTFKNSVLKEQAVIFALLFCILSLGLFSLSSRTASRYLFVTNYFIAILLFSYFFAACKERVIETKKILLAACMLLFCSISVKSFLERDNRNKYKIPYTTIEERDQTRR